MFWGEQGFSLRCAVVAQFLGLVSSSPENWIATKERKDHKEISNGIRFWVSAEFNTKMFFKEWKEFVVYPVDSSRVKSREQRLDIANASRIGIDGRYPAGKSSEMGCVIPLTQIEREGDVFECMEVADYGHVYIWTRDKVWFLAREGNYGRIEKLRYVPRHPPKSPFP
jgi:hypothetical protein